MRNLKIYWKYFTRFTLAYRSLFLLNLTLLLAGTLFQIPAPLIMKKIIDEALPSKNLSLLLQFGIFLLIVVLIREATNYFQKLNYQKLKNRVYERLVGELLVTYYQQPYSVVRSKDPGYYYSRIFEEPRELEESLTETAAFSVKLVLIFLFGVIVCFKLSPLLTLIVLGSLPLLRFVNGYFNKRLMGVASNHQESQAQFREYAMEVVKSYKIVNLFDIFGLVLKELHQKLVCILDLRKARTKLRGVYAFYYNIFSDGLPLLIFLLGVLEIIKGRFTIGGLVAYFELMRYIVSPVESFSEIFSEISQTVAQIDRFESLKDSIKRKGGKTVKEIKKISLREVTLNLCDFSLGPLSYDFEKGKKYVILGGNGSGKSTLIDILTGFLKVKGEVIVNDNLKITDIDSGSYLKRFAVSYFPPVLLPYVESNLELIKDKEIKDFIISEVIKGRDNLRVSQLSSGERQKLNLALVLSRKDVDFLILDEPFSNIDQWAKKEVWRLIESKLDGQGLIIMTPDLKDLQGIKDGIEILTLKGGLLCSG